MDGSANEVNAEGQAAVAALAAAAAMESYSLLGRDALRSHQAVAALCSVDPGGTD